MNYDSKLFLCLIILSIMIFYAAYHNLACLNYNKISSIHRPCEVLFNQLETSQLCIQCITLYMQFFVNNIDTNLLSEYVLLTYRNIRIIAIGPPATLLSPSIQRWHLASSWLRGPASNVSCQPPTDPRRRPSSHPNLILSSTSAA